VADLHNLCCLPYNVWVMKLTRLSWMGLKAYVD